jgi:hypothetical protein
MPPPPRRAASDQAGACNALTSFLAEVKAQKKLTVAEADVLLASATNVKATIGC